MTRSTGQGFGSIAILVVAGCLNEPPLDHVANEVSSADDDGSESGAAQCELEPPDDGCVELFDNGTLDDWFGDATLPVGWDIGPGASTRAPDDDVPCPPTVQISAGSPRDDGVVWQFGHDFVDADVPVGSTVHFAANIRLVDGVADDLRMCFGASPASICEGVEGFTGDGWVSVSSDFVADQPVVLYDFDLSSKVAEQQVYLDDLRLWVCKP